MFLRFEYPAETFLLFFLKKKKTTTAHESKLLALMNTVDKLGVNRFFRCSVRKQLVGTQNRLWLLNSERDGCSTRRCGISGRIIWTS